MASSGWRPIPPAFDPTTRDTGPLSPRTGARAWDRDGNGAGAGSGSNLSSPALRKVSLNTTISRLSNAQVAPADIDTPKAGLPAVRAVSVLKRMSTKMPRGSQTREGSMISDYYDKIQRADNRLSRAKEMQKVGYVLDPRYSKFVPRCARAGAAAFSNARPGPPAPSSGTALVSCSPPV